MPDRLSLLAIAGLLLASPASAGCESAPFAETPASFLRAFEQRMAVTGAPAWFEASATNKGPMYASVGTEIRLAIEPAGGLIKEASLLMAEPTPDDVARVTAAAAFVGSRFGGVTEHELAPEIAKRVRSALKDKQNSKFQRGQTIWFFQILNGKSLFVAIGNRTCE